MRSLTLVALGLGLAAFDFRTDAVDLLPDPLGWALVAIGAYRLGMAIAAGGAAVAAVLSVSEAALPFRYVSIDPVTAEEAPLCRSCPQHLRYDDVGQVRAVAIALAIVFGCAATVRLLHRLQTRVGPPHDAPNLRHHLRILELLVPAAWALPTLVVVGSAVGRGEEYDPVWNDPLAYVGLVGLLVLAWTIAAIARFSEFYPQPLAHLQPDSAD